MAARKLLKDIHPFIGEILDGAHDEILDQVTYACKVRMKNRFRKGMRVMLTGTKNPALDGKVGVVTRVNQKTVAVGLGTYDAQWGIYSDGDYNVPPAMLTAAPVAVAA